MNTSWGYRRGDLKQQRGDHVSESDQERLTRSKSAGNRVYELQEGDFFHACVAEGREGFATEHGIYRESEGSYGNIISLR